MVSHRRATRASPGGRDCHGRHVDVPATRCDFRARGVREWVDYPHPSSPPTPARARGVRARCAADADRARARGREARSAGGFDRRDRTAHRRPAQPGAGHRSGRDRRVGGVPRRTHRREGRPSRALRAAEHAAARATAERGHPGLAQHPLRQHHRGARRAVLPRRRGARAPLPLVDPLERRRHGDARAAPRHRRRRAHLLVRVRRDAHRGGPQPLLPRQGPPGRR